MPISKIKSGSLDTGSITTDKIATDAITEAKIADTAIENEHLNTNVISGQSELSESAEATDSILIYDTSTGTLKKVNVINVNLGNPTISSITPTNVDSKDSATTTTFIVTGTNFYTGTSAKLISNSAVDISFTTVTRDSNTQLTCVLNNALVTAEGVTDEPYDIFVNNGIGTTTLTNQVNVDQRPVFVTAAGSLGSVTEGNAANFIVEATDPESAGAIRYDVVGNSLPSGLSLNTATGAITGTAGAIGADTTSTFTIQASDVDSNVSFREFSITVTNYNVDTFTSSGTFSVPVGVTAVNVLVVAGGAVEEGLLVHTDLEEVVQVD
jgi:large repetitive protein